jgi:hypothetical protein
MDEKVERQIAILNELIDTYRKGRLPLNTLVQRIEGISNFIEISWWKEGLFPILLTLEQINAAALDSGDSLSERDRGDIASALDDIDTLIKRARDSQGS